jgi:hypothetical protein
MATNRTRNKRGSTKIHPAIYEFLATGLWPSPRMEGQNRFWEIETFEAFLPEFELVKDEILAAHIRKHPCSRPKSWWQLLAPRWYPEEDKECFWYGLRPEPRLRISGTGKFHHNMPGDLDKGIPGPFYAETLNPEKPLIFESETAYLQRHELLTDTEKQYLKKHPALLEPELIEA